MAYELGNNIYNYFYEPLKYYSKDIQIFNKALQILFSLKPHELKYNIKRINETFELLMGIPFVMFAFDGKYIQIEIENKEKLELGQISKEDYNMAAVWDRNDVFESLYKGNPHAKPPWESESISLLSLYNEELLDKFEKDISYFYFSIKDYIEFYHSIESSSKSLVNIKASCDVMTNEPLSLLLVRNDGCEFEIELSDNDLDFLIGTLGRLKDGSRKE